MSETINEKLTDIKDQGKKMQAVLAEIHEKEELIADLQRILPKMKRLPHTEKAIADAIEHLLAEVESEKSQLSSLSSSL